MTVHTDTMGERLPRRLKETCRCTLRLAALIALLAAATAFAPSAAHAGYWMKTNCVNPDGSPAPNEGWTGFPIGNPSVGSTNKAKCAPGDPMVALLSMEGPAPAGSAEGLEYTPPDGSTLAGGTVFVGLSAEGYTYGTVAVGAAVMYTPRYAYDASNVFMRCMAHVDCQNGPPNYYGTVELPRDLGGHLYLAAECISNLGIWCAEGGGHNAWSLVSVAWANLLLSTASVPTATELRGSLLEPSAHGTAGLAFGAADTGPGVWKVTVTIDGKPVYDATPNTNGGRCVPVGTDAGTGALMWAWEQPCPRAQTVDLTIKTTTLADGPHELKITVQNAAGDTSTVLRREITTNNRTTVSSGLTSDRPTTGSSVPAPIYAVALDPPTQKVLGGARHVWSRSGITLSGTLRNSLGVPVPGALVTLFAQDAGQGAPRPVARATTDAAGHWILIAPRGLSRLLTISYGESPDPASAQAIKVRQIVKPNVSLRIRALGRGRLRFSGRVRIRPLGSPRPLVVIQTRNGKAWKKVGSSIRVRRSGSYSITIDGEPDTIGGRYAFRTAAHATSLFATGVSPVRKTRVR
ncbi:MAG TPA: carboxypeptidase-like regulatory domain-containing protein [Solirubrobacteraceae bacterium]|jgi:hypothetical protein|nr:carboxypeptidase-like regulatory domain-containing protein [Solirubrobacteraceae bacterium]